MEASTKVKSKNLDVVKEYEKSGMKKVCSFVVIGKCEARAVVGRTDLMSCRPC